jgi:hypothetical protein
MEKLVKDAWFGGVPLGLAALIMALPPQLASAQAKPASKTAARATTSRAAAVPLDVTAEAAAWRARQGLNFKRNWGVEIVNVKPVSSGYMLALRYRVLDSDKAVIFNDRKVKAYLVDEASGIVLAVPALENVGELRPGAAPEAGRIYFMIFGNPGKLVKTGSRVSLRVGNLTATGMVVE